MGIWLGDPQAQDVIRKFKFGKQIYIDTLQERKEFHAYAICNWSVARVIRGS